MESSEILGNAFVDCVTITNGTVSMSESTYENTRDDLAAKDKEIERLQEELKDLRLTAQLLDGPQTHDG